MTDLFLLILGPVALVILLVFVYPWAQERRERDLAKRLEQTRDPLLAQLEVDRLCELHRREANFFNRLAEYLWRLLRR